MYMIKKTLEIEAAHLLELEYESKCKNLHGHRWEITVYCVREKLDSDGMVVDFSDIKTVVSDQMDHKNLNDVFDFNPTAENIAQWVCDRVPRCVRVDVEESKGNVATFIDTLELGKFTRDQISLLFL
ncbi:MAG: 6-carboxytetrahydropterin synthase QueD [Candidatus Hodarchaeales archaeon]